MKRPSNWLSLTRVPLFQVITDENEMNYTKLKRKITPSLINYVDRSTFEMSGMNYVYDGLRLHYKWLELIDGKTKHKRQDRKWYCTFWNSSEVPTIKIITKSANLSLSCCDTASTNTSMNIATVSVENTDDSHLGPHPGSNTTGEHISKLWNLIDNTKDQVN